MRMWLAVLIALTASPPSVAQVASPGRTATTSVGQAGERQTRETVAQGANIRPTGRISNRVGNRVRNRIRNRIDRSYDLVVNADVTFVGSGRRYLRGAWQSGVRR